MSNLTATFNTGVTTLAGPNGAGKSSLFRVVAGLQRPNAGSVVMGTASSDPAHQWQRMVGYLPQEPDFSGGVSVTDTVALAGWLKSMPDAELNNAVRDALNLVGLTDRARDRVRALSGGMRRRLGFATAAVHRPALLVLDEPTAWNWRISACRPRSGDELPAVAPHVGWTLSRSGRHRPRRRTPVARLVVSGQLGGHHLEGDLDGGVAAAVRDGGRGTGRTPTAAQPCASVRGIECPGTRRGCGARRRGRLGVGSGRIPAGPGDGLCGAGSAQPDMATAGPAVLDRGRFGRRSLLRRAGRPGRAAGTCARRAGDVWGARVRASGGAGRRGGLDTGVVHHCERRIPGWSGGGANHRAAAPGVVLRARGARRGCGRRVVRPAYRRWSGGHARAVPPGVGRRGGAGDGRPDQDGLVGQFVGPTFVLRRPSGVRLE